MPLPEARTQELQNLYGTEATILSGGNVYSIGIGYRTDHILPIHRRDKPEHWNAQFQNAKAFSKEWKPRSGPLDFIELLIKKREQMGIKEPLVVLNMGAGLGDFTVDLARKGNIHVTHVDFSQQANQVALQNVAAAGVEKNVDVVTDENREFLRRFRRDDRLADFIFFYGGLVENTPMEADIVDTLRTGADVLRPGGYMWIVCLEQPYLTNRDDDHVVDIVGEYPSRLGLAREIVTRLPGMYVVRDERADRPDNHPLRPGGESEPHMHMVYRGLFTRLEPGQPLIVPEFSFK